MSDNNRSEAHVLGARIREIRKGRGLTLAALAERVGTSAPTLHRYESGWDRFELATLRRIAAALDARLEIRLVTQRRRAERSPRSPSALVRHLKPLFWDRPLRASDFVRHPDWVLARVLTTGDTDQVEAARSFFGDEAIANVIDRRDVDGRTRNYWRLILAGGGRAPQGSAA